MGGVPTASVCTGGGGGSGRGTGIGGGGSVTGGDRDGSGDGSGGVPGGGTGCGPWVRITQSLTGAIRRVKTHETALKLSALLSNTGY
jgi:hypothetical protein